MLQMLDRVFSFAANRLLVGGFCFSALRRKGLSESLVLLGPGKNVLEVSLNTEEGISTHHLRFFVCELV
jgi:hypothetical protein